MQTVTIEVLGIPETFELDFDEMTWSAGRAFSEDEFPLIAHIDEKRYELYSDGTFDEEELAHEPEA